MIEETIRLPFDLEPAPGRKLISGDLTCLYETGRIRYLQYQDVPVIRLMYTAVRDREWNTANITISNETVLQSETGFMITYDAYYLYEDAVFAATIGISAENNKLSFSFKGQATKDFERNRIGICVLLPVFRSTEKKLHVTQPDGSEYTIVFPDLVSPHQPAKNIRRMSWQINNHGIARFQLDGDIFEMEDQRNWSDDSFKIYSTPVDLPLPVKIFINDTVEQQVNFWVDTADAPLYEELRKPELSSEVFPMPEIGYCRVPGHELTETEIRFLKQVPFHHYRVELNLTSPSWIHELVIATREVKALQTVFELIIFADTSQKKWSECKKALEPLVAIINSILVVDAINGKPSMELLDQCRQEFASLLPAVSIGYGTNNHFADLNRNPPNGEDVDFLSYGITPQAHADDLRTIIENLSGQSPSLVKSETVTAPGKKIHISPVTFKARIRKDGDPDRNSAPEDSRLHTHTGAFWTLYTLANLRGSQVTLFDTVGETGIIRNTDNELSPLFNCLRKLKEFMPQMIQKTSLTEVTFINAKEERLTFVIDPEFQQAVNPFNEHH